MGPLDKQPKDTAVARALRQAQHAEQQLQVIRRERDEAIYQAAQLGASRRQIAAAVGISLGAAHNRVVAGSEAGDTPQRH